MNETRNETNRPQGTCGQGQPEQPLTFRRAGEKSGQISSTTCSLSVPWPITCACAVA